MFLEPQDGALRELPGTAASSGSHSHPADSPSPPRPAPRKPTHLVQLSLRLFFHPSNVVHGQVNPLIEPTEQLPVEVCKQTPLLL